MRLYNQLSVLYIQYTKIDFQLNNRNSNKFDLNFSPLNVYPSKTSLFKHFGRQVCMKWYPLAHLAAVTMSCFCEELQALQLLFPNSAGGIARAFPSFLLYIFKFPDSRCRPLVSFSDNLNPFQRCRWGIGSMSCVRSCVGGNGQIYAFHSLSRPTMTSSHRG